MSFMKYFRASCLLIRYILLLYFVNIRRSTNLIITLPKNLLTISNELDVKMIGNFYSKFHVCEIKCITISVYTFNYKMVNINMHLDNAFHNTFPKNVKSSLLKETPGFKSCKFIMLINTRTNNCFILCIL